MYLKVLFLKKKQNRHCDTHCLGSQQSFLHNPLPSFFNTFGQSGQIPLGICRR